MTQSLETKIKELKDRQREILGKIDKLMESMELLNDMSESDAAGYEQQGIADLWKEYEKNDEELKKDDKQYEQSELHKIKADILNNHKNII